MQITWSRPRESRYCRRYMREAQGGPLVLDHRSSIFSYQQHLRNIEESVGTFSTQEARLERVNKCKELKRCEAVPHKRKGMITKLLLAARSG